ncbi:MAG: hypothetical protein ABJI96_08205 [Paracoccaceae bacterium]
MKYIGKPIPHCLYSEAYVIALMGLDEEEHLLETWRNGDVGPKWVNLPTGGVRYFGHSLIAHTRPGFLGDDPRKLFPLMGEMEAPA